MDWFHLPWSTQTIHGIQTQDPDGLVSPVLDRPRRSKWITIAPRNSSTYLAQVDHAGRRDRIPLKPPPTTCRPSRLSVAA